MSHWLRVRSWAPNIPETSTTHQLVSRDTSVDLHDRPTKVTSKVDKADLQVPGDAAAMAILYLDWKPAPTFPETHPPSRLRPGITRTVDCRAIAKRVCILGHKDFFYFSKRPRCHPNDPTRLQPLSSTGHGRSDLTRVIECLLWKRLPSPKHLS